MTTTVKKEGRRYYIEGNTYSIKDQLKRAGCKFDWDTKRWWTGKKEVAAKFDGKEVARKEETGDNLRVIGRASYKGKTYYVVWTGPTKYGTGWKLAFRDGSKVFWSNGETPQWIKRYDEPRTIGELRAYAKAQDSRRSQKPAVRNVPSEPLNSPPQQARDGEVLMQGKDEYYEGDVVALLVSEGELAKMENPVEVPAAPNAKPAPAGRVRIAVYVTASWSYSEDEAEDFDYFDRRFFASARAATSEEARPLIERRQKALANADAGHQLDEIISSLGKVDAAPDWATEENLVARWNKPVMVHTGAFPRLYIHDGQAYYHVPGYFACDWDYPAVHKIGPVDERTIRELVDGYDGCK